MIKHVGFAAAMFFVCCTAGCASKPPPRILKLSEVRVGPPRARMTDVPVSKDQYVEATKDLDALNRLRLVPILKGSEGESAEDLPEYRLFNVTPTSPYALAGLRNNDVLVAANDAVVYEPERFKLFMQALYRDSQPFIEIRRGIEPIVLKVVWGGVSPPEAPANVSK